MLRYRDARGLTHTIVSTDAVRAAVADGRIKPATPVAQDDGGWTIARLHPAYQEAVAALGPAGMRVRAARRPAARGWSDAVRDVLGTAAGRLLLVALAAGAMYGGVVVTGGRVTRAERLEYDGALAAMAAGDMGPIDALGGPPDAKSLRPTWALLTGMRDVVAHMDAAQDRLGFGDEVPAAWLSDDYVLRPTAYPAVPAHWTGMRRFHAVYVDSLLPLAEAAVRSRAGVAGLSERALERALRDVREELASTVEVHRVTVELAGAALEVHAALLASQGRVQLDGRDGGLLFVDDRGAARYERGMAAFEALGARLDSLESAGRARADAALKRRW